MSAIKWEYLSNKIAVRPFHQRFQSIGCKSIQEIETKKSEFQQGTNPRMKLEPKVLNHSRLSTCKETARATIPYTITEDSIRKHIRSIHSLNPSLCHHCSSLNGRVVTHCRLEPKRHVAFLVVGGAPSTQKEGKSAIRRSCLNILLQKF